MALQMNLSLENGISLPNAYIKIVELKNILRVGESEKLQITLNIYKDKDARFDKKPEVLQFYHECSGSEYLNYFAESILAQTNITMLSQCYEWLKTLSIYSTAISVLDEK